MGRECGDAGDDLRLKVSDSRPRSYTLSPAHPERLTFCAGASIQLPPPRQRLPQVATTVSSALPAEVPLVTNSGQDRSQPAFRKHYNVPLGQKTRLPKESGPEPFSNQFTVNVMLTETPLGVENVTV